MLKRSASAYKQLRTGNISVQQAISLLVVDGELNYQFLDQKLIASVSKNWPLRQAIPLFLADDKLYIACQVGSIPALKQILPKFVNKFDIEY